MFTKRDSLSSVRDYWQARAAENAVWYVDTSLDYSAPDMKAFWETGRRIVTDMFELSPIRPSSARLAIEIGSGLGRVCKALAEHFDEVIGVDVSEEMVVQSRRLVDNAQIRFVLGEGNSLAGIEAGAADFVASFTVFQHQPKKRFIADYIHEAGRVLGEGGVLAVQWNNDKNPLSFRLHGYALRLRRRLGLLDDPRAAAPFVGVVASVAFMKKHAAAAGLRVVEVKNPGSLFAWLWAVKDR